MRQPSFDELKKLNDERRAKRRRLVSRGLAAALAVAALAAKLDAGPAWLLMEIAGVDGVRVVQVAEILQQGANPFLKILKREGFVEIRDGEVILTHAGRDLVAQIVAATENLEPVAA